MTEHEITGAMARALRESTGLAQAAFWEPLGVSQSVGCRYEQQNVPIPRPVRILLVTHYVSGVKIDTASPEGVAELSRLGSIQSRGAQAKQIAGTVRTDIAKAIKRLEDARQALQTL